jgi:hypothetical protein
MSYKLLFFIIRSLNNKYTNQINSKFDDLGSILFNCFKNRLMFKKWTTLNTIIIRNTLLFLFKVIKFNHGKYLFSELTQHTHKTIKSRNNNLFIHKHIL